MAGILAGDKVKSIHVNAIAKGHVNTLFHL